MSEQNLVGLAQQAIGTADTILAGAVFQPRGTAGGTMLGEGIGRDAGNMMGGGIGGLVGAVAGGAIGYEKGRNSGGFSTDRTDGMIVHRVPFVSMVAVSSARIYAWHMQLHGMHSAPTDQLFGLDLAEVAVSVHSRVSVRTFEVLHESASEKWEFESPRINGHLGPLLDAIHLDAPQA
jgi:hypothetical protein